MTTKQRHHVHCYGAGAVTMVFLHGYGCDQTMWRFLIPAFATRYHVIAYDLVGSGNSDLAAYDPQHYASLHAHADDLLAVIAEFARGPVIMVGHSVSAMIGMLATIKQPAAFAAQVMLGPSACYINDETYVGGFNSEDIEDFLQLMMDNYADWTAKLVMTILGANGDRALITELQARFMRNDSAIARHFARVTFTADHRADLADSRVPTLILQCSDDLIAPREVGQFLHRQLPNSQLAVIDNDGHCPHLSSPTASAALIDAFVEQLGCVDGTLARQQPG